MDGRDVRTTVGDNDLGKPVNEGDRTDGLDGLGLLATAELEVSAFHRDSGRVIEAVVQVLRAGSAIEKEAAILNGDTRGVRQRRFVAEDDVATVEQRSVRVSLVGIERQGILTLPREADVARDAAGPITASIILIDDERARAAARSDCAVRISPGLIAEERVDLLDVAVEVEDAVGQRHVIIGHDCVLNARTELDRALIDDELTTESVGTQARQPVDERGRRSNHEGAGTRLDGRDGTVSEAITAVHGGTDRQLRRTDDPEVERREVVRLIEHATAEDGGATMTHEDATGREAETHAIGQRDVRTAFDRERVRHGVHADRRGGIEGELQVVTIETRGDIRRGVFRNAEGTDNTVGGQIRSAAGIIANGSKGITLLLAGLVGTTDDRPREDALVHIAGAAARAVEAHAAREDNVRVIRIIGDTEVITAEEH